MAALGAERMSGARVAAAMQREDDQAEP